MPVVEIGFVAAGVAGAAAVGAAADFINSRREWWALQKRPVDHPFKCDFRVALGLPLNDVRFNASDVRKHEKKALLWWHPDKDPSLPADAFCCFTKAVNVLKNPTSRRAYISHVEKFQRVAPDLPVEQVNKLFLDDAEGKTAIKAGNKVMIVSLEKQPELNGKQGEVLGWISETMRWKVAVENTNKVVALKTENLDAVSSSPEGNDSMIHLFLDSSTSMSRHMKIAKDITTKMFPKFAMTNTAVHTIGTKEGPCRSKQFFDDISEINEEMEWEIMQDWKAQAGGTFLWEYIHRQIQGRVDFAQEVIIVTDGEDNCSSDEFRGLKGFNKLMAELKGKPMRISLILIGNDLPEESTSVYRDLCMATGGMYVNCKDNKGENLPVDNFVLALLLPEGQRNHNGLMQQRAYEQALTNGEAENFDWYLPIADTDGGNLAGGRSSSSGYPEPSRPSARSFGPSGNVTVTSYS